ncbi:MAG: fluoride efflux transporter CrcB [Halobacteriota archaeon]|nr:fluoride efflux transporter CrcB [Halobacteriota archaeon]
MKKARLMLIDLRFLLIAAGGAIGALSRYAISITTWKRAGDSFPLGTLFVNLIGAFVIGLLWGFAENNDFSSDMHSFIFIGILGSFTTFSTYSLETLNLFREGNTSLALINILVINLLGITLAFVGFVTSRYLINLIGTR